MPQRAHIRLRLTQHKRDDDLFHGRQDADRDRQMEEPGRAASEEHHGTATDYEGREFHAPRVIARQAMKFPEGHEWREHAAREYGVQPGTLMTHNRWPEPPRPQRQGDVEHTIAHAIHGGTQGRRLPEPTRQNAVEDIRGKRRRGDDEEDVRIAIPGEQEQHWHGRQATPADQIRYVPHVTASKDLICSMQP